MSTSEWPGNGGSKWLGRAGVESNAGEFISPEEYWKYGNIPCQTQNLMKWMNIKKGIKSFYFGMEKENLPPVSTHF